MKGIILAGGHGTRLQPMTNVTNKHLLPVYDKPMCYYPINTLTTAGIKDIMFITGSEHAGGFINLLGTGKNFNASFTYRVQDGAGGIAEALGLCEDFAKNEPIVVILGDNIFEDNIEKQVDNFSKDYSKARVFLKKVEDPTRFGIATIEDDEIISIEEKPKNPKSELAVTGLYFYNSSVWNIIKLLKPSNRGEKEITDVNNWYVKQHLMKHEIIEGFWSDAGQVESLYRASTFIRSKK
jgi:glucose-1-phosphate thymidylyltransferase